MLAKQTKVKLKYTSQINFNCDSRKDLMKKIYLNTILVLSLLVSYCASADTSSVLGVLRSDEDFNYSDFYQIKEDPRLQFINLLVFDHINEKFPLPAIPYNRDTHFGGWLRDNTGGTCLNTRGKVLVRDSASSVSYSPNGCTVEGGHWDDPYTALIYTSAKDIQIDHVVALKNAYMTGAHEWDFKKRCLYANYLGNEFHLLSVNGKENLKKSDSSPSAYVPPNKTYTCQFIKVWLNIKLIWTLRETPKEREAIIKIATENNCNPQDFIISAVNLKEQRNFMADNANLCATSTTFLQNFSE